MHIKPIKSDGDHRRALKEIDRLMDARVDTPEGDRLHILTTLVVAWEEEHHAIPLPDPVDAINFAMEQRSLMRRDLEPLIGSRARVAEILNRRRKLTLPMIRRLHDRLGIPAESLIAEPKSSRAA